MFESEVTVSLLFWDEITLEVTCPIKAKKSPLDATPIPK
jgi:hypothetical protein